MLEIKIFVISSMLVLIVLLILLMCNLITRHQRYKNYIKTATIDTMCRFYINEEKMYGIICSMSKTFDDCEFSPTVKIRYYINNKVKYYFCSLFDTYPVI